MIRASLLRTIGLIGDLELLAGESLTEITLEAAWVGVPQRFPQGGGLMSRAALSLRLVHRLIGLDHQGVADVFARTCVGHPDAGGDGELDRADDEGHRKGVVDTPGQCLDIGDVAEVLAQEDELVAGEPGESVAGTH